MFFLVLLVTNYGIVYDYCYYDLIDLKKVISFLAMISTVCFGCFVLPLCDNFIT